MEITDMEAVYSGLTPESMGPWAAALRDMIMEQISVAVGTLTVRAEASARAAVEQATEQLRATEAALRGQLATSGSALDAERETTRTLADELASERTARERAAALHAQAQASHEEALSACATRLRALEAELETGRRERAQLASQLSAEAAERAQAMTVLQSVRAALGGGEIAAVLGGAIPMATAATGPAPALPSLAAVDAPAENPSSADCAGALLDEVEASYLRDTEETPLPSELVDRLIGHLRTARELYVAQCGTETVDVFDRQLSALLNTKGSLPFGRHLSVASYEVGHAAA
jgi:hypothetical protein